MEKKTLQTEKGRIVYWTSGPDRSGGDKDTGIRIVFLPGLSADRRLFETAGFSKNRRNISANHGIALSGTLLHMENRDRSA